MDLGSTIILGLTQGITWFLPVSTDGHLLLEYQVMSLSEGQILALATTFYLTASGTLMFYFRLEIWTLIQAVIRRLGRLPTNESDLTKTYALFLATLPGIIFVLLTPDLTPYSTDATFIAVSIFCMAIFYMFAEWKYYLRPTREALTVKKGFLVGLFQVFTFVPGFSQLGATLTGGMLLGLNRLEAARFSFILAIPITLVIGLKKLFTLSSFDNVSVFDWSLLLGVVISLTAVLFTTHFFLIFIKRHSLWPFVWYNLVLVFLVGYVAFFAQN